MNGPLALGVDIGTGGVRAACIDKAGAEVGLAAADMAEFGPDRRDPAVWDAALGAALSRLGDQVDLSRVGAVSVDGTSGTVLALDAGGAPVGTALMYNDAVDDADLVARIAAAAPQDTAARGATSALIRAIALQDRPGVARIVHQADWIAERLSGRPGPSDESNALKTGYDPVTRRWPGWLSATPLMTELLPAVIPAGDVSGRASGAYGLAKDALLVAGVTDGCASFLATGSSAPGDAVTALGTTMTIKLLSDSPIFAPEYGIYSHRIGDLWLAGGASNTGGGVLAAHFSAAQIADLSGRIDPNAKSGLDYYPLTEPGERFPIADPAYPPRLSPRPDDDAAFLHGMLEGIARIEALSHQRLAALGAPRPLAVRTVGGGARNDVWTAMRARILDAEMADAESVEAAVGVARLARARLPA
ncbi:MAG: FGGY-family carbohydrate kinase [Pseudomonadota bacterium]